MFGNARAATGRVAAIGGLMGAGLAASVAVAPAANADSWKTISESTSCVHYSFGDICTTKTTKLRQVDYCTDPPISNPWSQMAWATYCLRYTETSA